MNNIAIFYTRNIDTPLGPLTILSDERALHIVRFADGESLIENARRESSSPIDSLEEELDLYFRRKLTIFKTPIFLQGTHFQRSVWQQIASVPFGKTVSYSQLGASQSPRPIAQACGANRLALIVPCHRIIYKNGGLGGYNGGVFQKKWLLTHEGVETSSIVF